MELLKRSNKVKATSILESVVALCIISICLYIAMTIFAVVLTPKSSPRFYNSQNKANELFFLSQLEMDSLYNTDNITIEKEGISNNLDEITIKYKDSSQIEFEKKFYLLDDNEE